MEDALWRFAVTARDWGSDQNEFASKVPAVFRSRVKKLLDMDRIPELRPWKLAGKDQWAFYDGAGDGSGSDQTFRTEHVFVMGVGLDLLSQGLKPSEIVFVLRHIRAELECLFFLLT